MIKTNERTYCVYIHRNTINNKRYVGITSKLPEERWGRGGYGYYNNKHFMSAIKKYGWNAFEHTIIATNLSSYDACKIEQDLIKQYNSNNPLFGYNICAGGETNILPRSSLDKISKKNKGRIMTDEVKHRRAKNPNPPKAIKVVCDGIEFKSITDCAKHYNINPREMNKWIDGDGYLPEYFMLLGLKPLYADVEYQECYSKRKWVFCDDKEYPSVYEFCRQENMSPDTVNGWFYGKYKMREDYVKRGLKRDYKKFYKMIIKEK